MPCQSINSYKLFIITLITIITKIKRNRKKKIIKKRKRKMALKISKIVGLIAKLRHFVPTGV